MRASSYAQVLAELSPRLGRRMCAQRCFPRSQFDEGVATMRKTRPAPLRDGSAIRAFTARRRTFRRQSVQRFCRRCGRTPSLAWARFEKSPVRVDRERQRPQHRFDGAAAIPLHDAHASATITDRRIKALSAGHSPATCKQEARPSLSQDRHGLGRPVGRSPVDAAEGPARRASGASRSADLRKLGSRFGECEVASTAVLPEKRRCSSTK